MNSLIRVNLRNKHAHKKCFGIHFSNNVGSSKPQISTQTSSEKLNIALNRLCRVQDPDPRLRPEISEAVARKTEAEIDMIRLRLMIK